MNVLIVNDNLVGEANAVGYCMKNMLYNMPNVQYLQYCVDLSSKGHPELLPTVYCNITDSLSFCLKELLYAKASKKPKQNKRHSEETMSFGENTEDKNTPTPKTKLGQATDVSPKREFLSAVFYSMPCRVSKANQKVIKAFKPDVIYTLAENMRVINQAIKISKMFKIPIVYHGMDDWKSTAYVSAGWVKPMHRLLEYRFRRMHHFSVKNLAICEKMAKRYEADYRIPFSYASNCILEYGEEGYQFDSKRPVKIVFSGSLHLYRGEVLQEISELIDSLNESGRAFEMEIISPAVHLDFYADAVHKYSHTTWRTYEYPQTDKIKDLCAADILLLAESPREQEVKYARYSFSTKIPEYLAIGRCILAYGSNEQSSIQFIDDMGCGPAVHDMKELHDALVDLYDHPEKMMKYAETSFKVGKEQFSQCEIQRKIYDVLLMSSKETGSICF